MGNEIEGSTLPEELPPLPCGWRYEALGDLVDDRGVCYGIVQPGSADARGVPIVRVNNIRDGRIDTANILRVSPGVESKFGRSRLRGGEVLLTLVGTLGEVAVVPDHLQGWNVARAVGVIPVREDPGAQWVAVCLRSGFIQRCIRAWATTTVQATFNLRDLAKLPIPVPPTRQRGGITSVLGALDDKIDLNRRMCQTLEEMARALFKSWFVDFDPVRAKMEGRDPGLPTEIADLFPSRLVDSELGPIPEGWRVAALGEVVSELETGGRPRGGVAGILAGVPSVGAESITGLGQFDFAKTKYVPVEYYEAMTRGKVRSRDVLLYKDGGRPGEFEPHVSMFGDGFPFAKCSINEHVYRIRGSAELPQNFLYFHLSSEPAMAEMRVKGTGVAIPGLNSTQARSLRVVLPLPAPMTMFDRTVEPIVARVLSAALESKQLATLRDTLLPKLISGELRVPASLGSMQEATT